MKTELTPEKLQQIREHPYYKPLNEKVIATADACLDKEIPVLHYRDFQIFFQKGTRNEYEGKSGQRRVNLNACVMAYLLTEDEKYLQKAEDYIWAICDEFSWAPPAHLIGRAPFELFSSYIDLGASGTACTLAEIHYLLKDKLSEFVRRRIEEEVERRVFAPYENRVIDFFWEKVNTNWAAVCAGNVGIALMRLAAPERAEKLLPRLMATMDCFFESYGEDGCCLEGFGYWNYGFGNFVKFAAVLRDYTNGRINYFTDDKVKEIAHFPQRVMMPGNTVINYADSDRKAAIELGLTHFLHGEYPDLLCPDNTVFNLNDKSVPGDFVDFLHTYLWSDPELTGDMLAEPLQHYMYRAQWFIQRNKTYALAAKAGHNAEPYVRYREGWAEHYENRSDRHETHNHNDIGNFIFYSGEECVFCDVGSARYVQDYFMPDHRYTYLATRSKGHSVPIVNGEEQKRDLYHSATVLSVGDNHFEFEMQGAYEVAELTRLVRRFDTDATGVTLTDTYDTTAPLEITERFISEKQPVLCGNEVHVGCGKLIFDPATVTCTISSDSFVDHTIQDHIVYFTDCTFTVNGNATVKFRME